MSRVTIFAVAASAGLLLYILEMVRRRRLREEYSILWLFGSGLILVLSLKPDWLNRIARAVGIAYPPSFLFLVGILFIILILIHFSHRRLEAPQHEQEDGAGDGADEGQPVRKRKNPFVSSLTRGYGLLKQLR